MDGKDCTATVYDRAQLKAGNRIAGPAIVMEMDSTTVILPKHHGKVDTLRQHPHLSRRLQGAEWSGRGPAEGCRQGEACGAQDPAAQVTAIG